MNREEIRSRVRELMADMTMEEKVRQLCCLMPADLKTPETLGIEDGIGAMPVLGGTPDQIAEDIRRVQEYVLANSRHKIPVMFHCEALAGPLVSGSSQFPLSISLGATFDPSIAEEMASINSRQMQAVGIHHALSPVLDVARDLRWGRLGETYGGDPVLCGAFGSAFVRGMQKETESGYGNAATLKHFLGYSATMGGLNMAQTVVSARDLRENFARPFEMAIRGAKARGVMNSYSEYDGKPVCASKELLTDLLRDDLGFEGVVVSDYGSVDRVRTVFACTEDITEAGKMCLSAGLDMEFPNRLGYSGKLAQDAENGTFDAAHVDRAVERVLTLKYELGLFEHPFATPDQLAAFDNTQNNQKSCEAAKKTMTLTKNEGLLPLTDRTQKIAVIGPMGSTPRAFYGCYTIAGGMDMMFTGRSAMAGVGDATDQPGIEEFTAGFEEETLDLHVTDDLLRAIYPDVKTTVEALQEFYPNLTWTEGCDYVGSEKNDFAAAQAAAKDADVVIMTLGGRNGWGLHCTSGEGIDSTDIGLPGCQEDLLRAVYEVNPKIVLVHTDVRPVVSEWIYENVPAILEAWIPCTYGGIAIAETICGLNNPGGRLQMDVPRSAAHGPVSHYLNRGTDQASFANGAIVKRGYRDLDMRARLPFGYGLSYTTFAYSDFTLAKDENDDITATVSVTNTGDVTGDEVVQLYGADPTASIVRPAEELIGFARITLAPGQTKRVRFSFNLDILSFYDVPGHWILEEGTFRFYIGKDSKNPVAEGTVVLEKTREIDHQTRCLIAKAEAEEA